MSETVAAHIAHGLALGGVLAIAGAWSLRAGGALPHLGVGAVAGVAVALGGRLALVPLWAAVVLVLLAGAACGRLAWSLDARVRSVAGRPAVTADVAVLGAAVATVGLLVPVGAAPAVYPPLTAAVLPSGVPVLGGWPGLPGGVAALALGGAAVWLLASSWASTATGERLGARRWAAAGAALAGAVVLGGGALVAGDAGARGAVLAAADPVGLAIRASAAALAGRGSTWRAAAAGLALGVAETLARVLDPTGAVVMLPAVAVVLMSVILAWDHRPGTPVAGTGR